MLGSSYSIANLPGLARWYEVDLGAYNTSDAPAANSETVKAILGQRSTPNATQGTDADRAVYTANAVNGKPALAFNGLSHRYVMASLALPGDFAMWFVQQTTGDGAFLGNQANSNSQIRIGQSGSDVLSIFDGAANPQSSALSVARASWSLVSYVRSGGTIAFYENGVAKGTGATSGTLTLDAVSGLSAASEFISGYVAAIVVAAASPTAAHRVAVDRILMTKYGLA